MAVKRTIFRPITLRGSAATEGIEFSDGGTLDFVPQWGMTRGCADSIAVASGAIDNAVTVKLTGTMPVIMPVKEAPTQELVLVQEYHPGCGAKRWPGFEVEHSLHVLATEETSGGSGWERWSLVIAPLGWSENIADQFQDYRDVEDQIISYEQEGEK